MKKLFLLFAISLLVSGPGATAAVDTLQRIKAMRKTYYGVADFGHIECQCTGNHSSGRCAALDLAISI